MILRDKYVIYYIFRNINVSYSKSEIMCIIQILHTQFHFLVIRSVNVFLTAAPFSPKTNSGFYS